MLPGAGFPNCMQAKGAVWTAVKIRILGEVGKKAEEEDSSASYLCHFARVSLCLPTAATANSGKAD